MPSSFVVRVDVAFLATSTTLTVAPGTAAPLGSMTRPVILPRNSCAPADASRNAKTKTVAAPASNRRLITVNLGFIFSSPLWGGRGTLWLAPRKLRDRRITAANQELKHSHLPAFARLVRPIRYLLTTIYETLFCRDLQPLARKAQHHNNKSGDQNQAKGWLFLQNSDSNKSSLT